MMKEKISKSKSGSKMSSPYDQLDFSLSHENDVISLPQNNTQYVDQALFESDKRSVYKHPLFPLLAVLFEKCEIATQSASDSPISDSFHQDLEAFILHQERDKKAFLLDAEEIDGLMIKAIQVLRIHLLELDKVQELCKDFCSRYITCLKGKMQSENLLRSEYGGGEIGTISTNINTNISNISSDDIHSLLPTPPLLPNNSMAELSPPSDHYFTQESHKINNTLPRDENSGTNATTIPHHYNHSSSSSSSTNTFIHGSTPLSQIGANTCQPLSFHDNFIQTPQSQSSGDEEDDYLGRKKPKRGVLPKHATSIMRSWLFQHIVHPYPTEDEKRQIAGQTNLTLLQVNNWFINARRRILQPMLDASNPEVSNTQKVKKLKLNSSKTALKYWSNNLSHSSGGGESEAFGDDANDLSFNKGIPDHSTDETDESSNEGNDLFIDDENENENSDGSRP